MKKVKGKKKAKTKSSASEIPFEVLQDILSRLPTKKCAQFRLVCKAWNKFFISEEYVKMRRYIPLLFYGQSKKQGRTDFLLRDIDKSRDVDDISNIIDVDASAKSDSVVRFTSEFFLENRKLLKRFIIVGNECNGILCVKTTMNWAPFILYNPLTGQQRAVNQTIKWYHSLYGYGLGYCSETHKFKVLRILKESRSSNYIAEIQTVDNNNDSWRSLDIGNVRFRQGSLKAFLRGSLHWCSCCKIWSFNFTNGYERFSCFSLPFGSVGSDHANVTVFCSKLCCTINSKAAKLMVVWVMEEYGEKNSWVKKFTVKQDNVSIFWIDEPIPVVQWGREILIRRVTGDYRKAHNLQVYDLDSKTCRPVKEHGVSNYSYELVARNPMFTKLPI